MPMALVVLKNIPTLSTKVTPADSKKIVPPAINVPPARGVKKNLIVPPNKDRTRLPKKLRSYFWGVLILET